MDDEKRKLIKKLENASYSNEMTTFLNKDMSDLRLNKLYLTNIIFRKCNFYILLIMRIYGDIFF